MKKLFTLFLLLVASIGTMFAWDYERVKIGNLYYNLDATNQTAEVTSQNSSSPYWSTTITTAIIPASVEYNSVTYSVTSIGERAFYDCFRLTSVTIPNSVTTIGSNAFNGRTGLTSVTIPNSVTSIGSFAFRGCSGLTSVTIGNSVTSIGSFAFRGCSGLTSVTIGNSVTSIGEYTFSHCSSLTSVTIPNSVTSIGLKAFENCSGLTSVTIGNGVTSIGKLAFNQCTGLTSVTCEATTPPTLESNVFSGVDTSIPLYVPCASIEAYKAADGWSEFTNIQAINPDDCGPCLLASGTCGAEGDNLTWELSCDSVLTISGTGEMRNYPTRDSVPWYISELRLSIRTVIIEEGVTNIGNRVFHDCSNIESISIPNSVTKIGSHAFTYCWALDSIVLPDSLISIGEGAFVDCHNLKSIDFPDGLVSIGANCFMYCARLSSVTIPASVSYISSPFRDCKNLTSIFVNPNNSTYDSRNNCNAIIVSATNSLVVGCKTTTIPENVTNIYHFAFANCKTLTSVIIPQSVTTIGIDAFFDCDSLKNITCYAMTPPIVDSTSFDKVNKNIPLYVLASSVNLYKSADGWKEFTNILPIKCLLDSGTCGAEGDGSNLTWELSCDSVLTIEGTGAMANYSNVSSVPWYSYNSSIQYVVIGNNVTSIGSWAFYGCDSLTSVTIPNSVTSIGEYAFAWCTGLTSVTIPNSVTSIGKQAFFYCSGLTSVTIPNSVNNIGSSAFQGCSGLTSVTIPGSVTSIGDMAFTDCTGLTSPVYNAHVFAYLPTSCSGAYTIPDGIESIAGWAFYGCDSLTSVTIPNSVTSIGEYAFAWCTGLTSVTIPNSVTNIGDHAFSSCTGLTSVTIGNSVTSIGDRAFQNCTGLTSITCEAVTPPTCGETNVFTNVNKSIPLYVPTESVEAYQAADVWKEFTNIQAIPGTETECLIASGTCGAQGDNLTWELSCDGVLTISGTGAMANWDNNDNGAPWKNYKKNIKYVTIADGVTSIGDYAFVDSNHFYNFTSITIPNSVTSIGDYAFYACNKLVTISNSDNLIKIGTQAFAFCRALPSLAIPKSVTNIGPCALYCCDALTSINVADDNSNYCSMDGVLFSKNKTILIQYPGGKQGAYTIPNNVNNLGGFAFSHCKGLTSVEIPNSVISIGNAAFSFCSGLTSIEIPNSVTSIGAEAFYECSSLTSVTIGNSVTSIGDEAFRKCSGLTSIVVASGNTKYDSRDNCNAIIETSSNTLIAGCQNTIIPNSVTSIGKYAFHNCTGLTSVTIPNSVTSIGLQTFAACTGLTSVTCEAITPPTCEDSYVFSNVNKSIPLYVPAESVEAYQAADIWKDFTNIQAIPGTEPCITASGTCGAQGDNLTWELSCEGVLTISGSGAMTDWSSPLEVPWRPYRANITSVTIPNSVTSIGKFAFFNCTGLTSVTIPNSVTSIKYGAFYGCKGLTSVTIPSSVTSIGGAAFSGCTGLTSMVVTPGNTTYDSRNNCNAVIETITNTLIAGCKNTTIPNSITSIGDEAFSDCAALTSVTIPNSVTSIGEWAFAGCSGLTSVTIPNSVTIIGRSAFSNCTGLTSITCEAVTPPSTGVDVFYNVDKSIPLYVPCASIDAYKNAEGWSEFTNIQAIDPADCAPTCPFSGTCGAEGDNLTWELSCDGVLTISGSGKMADWNGVPTPWDEHKEQIVTVVLPEGLTKIGLAAFKDCSNLTSINIPAGIKDIQSQTFRGCTSLSSIELPESITAIRSLAFYNCTSLASIIVPDNVTIIGEQAFRGCTSLTQAVIGNSVTTIDGRAFYGCTNLASVTLGNSVVTIEQQVFRECGITSVTIPASVTGIGDYAFYQCAQMSTLTFNNSAATIGQYAFKECAALTEVDLGNSLVSIGMSAFEKCSQLASVDIPASVTSIGDYGFRTCSALQSTTFHTAVPPTIGKAAFYETSGQFYVPCGSSDAYVTALGVTASRVVESVLPEYSIKPADEAQGTISFIREPASCDDLTLVFQANAASGWQFKQWSDGETANPRTVTAAEGLELTAEFELTGCEPLTGICGESLTWELSCDGVLTISGTGEMAKWQTTNQVPWASHAAEIISVVLPEGLTNIGLGAFFGCSNLTAIEIPSSVTSIGYQAFKDCSHLASVTMSSNVTEIGEYAFKSCVALSSIDIPEGVTNIAKQAFFGCSSLESIVIPNSATFIGELAFSGCSGLTAATIGNSVSSIGKQAFYGCSSLGTVVLPASVTSIGESAFHGCTSLTAVEMGNDVTTLGMKAFYNCSSLASINLSTAITAIGDATFFQCGSLTAVDIPAGVTSIGESAFQKCSTLVALTIPKGVTAIGTYAFHSCTSMTSATFKGAVPEFGSVPFGGNNTATLYVPCGSSNAYVTALSIPASRVVENVLPEYSIKPADEAQGTISFIREPASCDDLTLVFQANAASGWQFKQWSDGETANPRTVTAAEGLELTAEFELTGCEPLTGTCGESLTWELTCEGALIISGTGAMTDWNSMPQLSPELTYAPWYEHKDKIVSLSLPEGLTHIGAYAFYECSGLTSIEIPGTVTSIGFRAFCACAGLTSVTVPEAVSNLGVGGTFQECTSLTSVQWNATNCVMSPYPEGNQYAGQWAPPFYQLNNLKSITFSQNVRMIPACLCYEAAGLTSITSEAFAPPALGNTLVFEKVDKSTCRLHVYEISVDAYKAAEVWKEFFIEPIECTGSNTIASGTCGEDLTWSLSACGVLIIDGTGTTMTDWDPLAASDPTFAPWHEHNVAIASVVMPQTLAHIGDYAFYECSALVSVTIPDNVTSIGRRAFRGCTALNAVTMPANVTSLGLGGTFQECASLKSVQWNAANCVLNPYPEGHEYAGQYSPPFYLNEETKITGLTSFAVGANVQSVPSCMCFGLTGLESITCEAEIPPTTGVSVFRDVNKSIPLYVPAISLDAYKEADQWKDFFVLPIEDVATIIWQNEDGTLLEKDENVVYGTLPKYDGVTPVKEGNAQYTYTFIGWTPALSAVAGDVTYTATFSCTPNSYTITWLNEDGSLIDETIVEYGKLPTHADPVKEADAEFSYTFAGWTPDVVAITAEATYTATFEAVKNSYVIKFVNYNGDELQSSEVAYGETPVYGGAIPSKPADAQYTYTFAGWTPDVVAVTGEATYTATFEAVKNSYVIKFVNYDGTPLQSGEVEYGAIPAYNGETPSKPADAQYTYTFSGWSPEVVAVDGEATYTAQFTTTLKKYVISFVNYDGTPLQSGEVEYGAIPAYNGETPAKPADAQYTYTFSGWTPEVVAVNGEATYTAQFSSTVNKYLITFKNGEEILQSGEVEYGAIPAYNGETPTKPADAQYTYTFAGWSPEVVAVDGEATYTALFTTTLKKYVISFVNYDGTPLQSGEVEYGAIPAYNGEAPAKPADAQYTYTFAGWSPEVVAVDGEATYTAQFTTTLKKYVISFVNYDGTPLQSGEVEYGAIPAYSGATPAKPADAQYTYTFAGWSPEVVAVDGEATYTAQFTTTLKKYAISFVNYDGTPLQSGEVEYGAIPAYSGATPTKPADAQYTYTFAGWSPEVVAVDGEATYTALFTTTLKKYVISFVNYDGTPLQSGEVEYGAIPAYNGETPTKPADAQNTYTFAGWSPEVVAVNGEAIYTALFTTTLKKYVISFVNYDGTPLQSGEVEYGAIPAYSGATPTKPADAQYTYTFSGWTPEVVAVNGEAIYTAQFTTTLKKYAISFVNYDGTPLQSGEVEYGAIPAYNGETPTKPADAQYTYTFSGWTPEVVAVDGEATYTAQFTTTLKKYAISFVNYDGTPLQSGEVEYGAIPAYNGETPSKPADAQYTYTFAGWSPEVVAVNGEAIYTAQFTTTLKKYAISFVNYDGTPLQSSEVEYGAIPAYNGETPIKPADAQYTYTFAGWSPEVVAVDGEAIYTAQFTTTLKKYVISFVNYDGTPLQSGEVEYGAIPAYSGETPSKPADAQYTYTFAGWSPEVVAVNGEAIYTAQFTTTLKKYVISFVNYDGTPLQSGEVEYGAMPAYNGETPSKPADAQYTYTFAGWSPEVVAVDGEATYTAQFTTTLKKYAISFVNYDGTPLQSVEVEYGAIPAYSGATPAKPADAQYTYTFAGWSPEVVAVTGEATYTAQFTTTLKKYAISFVNYDGTPLQSGEVEYGAIPAYNGEAPAKPADAQYTYTFSGWTPEVVAVDGEATYTAQFTTTLKKYAISFVNYDGTPLQSGEVEYGAIPAYNGETPSKPADAQYTYTFAGWSPEVVAVDGEATYTAQFTTTLKKYVISFVNYDGTPLQSGEVEYGAMPAYNGEAPTKAADAQYTYTFAGWSPEVVAVDGEATYSAQFNSTVNKYLITFKNGEEVLQSSEIEFGAMPAYNGEAPTKAADAQYTYTFAGWSPEVVAVDGEATYTAQFTSTPIITGPIVIGNGESETLSDLDPAGTQFIEEIIVEIGGELNVDDANIHIDELVICVDGTNSGQVLHGIEGINAEHIYLEYILNPCGELASPNRWYAISVPFEVDIATGISRTCDSKTLVSGTDFLIKEYDGMQRATTGNGWKNKLSGTLEPGHFYMIGIDGNCNRWRFEKKAGQPCEGDTHMAYNEYTSDNSEDAGWNGLGNTMLEYMRMNMGLSDIVYIVTYDNCYGRFVTQLLAEINLCVGRPFFIQASSDGNFDFVFGSGSNNMPALYAQRESKPLMHFTLTDETQSTGTDHMFLTMHEDATADYTIGRDIARMSKDCKTAAQLWCTTTDGTQLSAHGISMPETGTVVPVTFFAPTKGEYLINMSSRAMDGYEVELLHNGAWVATLNAQPVSLSLNAGNNSGYSVRIVRRAQTDIENVQSDKVQSSKVLINEHIYIIRGEHMYSVQGELVK